MDVSRDTNFYYSFLVLPAEKRRAIVAVWEFCRAVDDAVDCPASATTGRLAAKPSDELTHWRAELDRCFGGTEPVTRQGQHLKTYVTHFRLPRDPFEDLIDGVAMDVAIRRYETFDELYKYCLRVASAVGLICIEIFGYRNSGTRDYAIALGVALQLTNIIRDVPTDLASGRLYLPLDDLRQFDLKDADLEMGLSPQVRALLEFECQRARMYYEKARVALPVEDARGLVAAEIMGGIYFAILERIERQGYDVFTDVVRVPRPRRALIAATIWTRVMLCGATQPRSD